MGVSIHKDDGEGGRAGRASIRISLITVLRLLIDLDGKAYGG
jgi:hypothetical protein